MEIGDSLITVGVPSIRGDSPRRGVSSMLYVYVDDVDMHYQQARATGAVMVMELHDRHCQLEPCEGAQRCLEVRDGSLSTVSWAPSAQGDISPDGVTLGADLSIGGGSEEVSTWTEMVTNGAERPQEALGVLG